MPNHPVLGQLITDQAFKDAVHIAIAPVVAAETLRPGQHIGLTNTSTNTVSTKAILIGIVDPFLAGAVKKGEQFFMCLYPQTVTNLRHDWAHPAWSFADVTRSLAVKESITWVTEFADRVGLDYDELIEAAACFVASGELLSKGALLDGESVPDEFWQHYEVITGQVVASDKQHSFFSCGC